MRKTTAREARALPLDFKKMGGKTAEDELECRDWLAQIQAAGAD